MSKNNKLNALSELRPSDDLFQKITEESSNKVVDIEINKIKPYHNNVYSVRDDDEMEELSESIKNNGILSPLLVIKVESGYEAVSGSRRLFAANKAGISKVPCIVLDIDQDTADIYMNQSNKYRENILLSEKAWGYRLEYDARKRLGDASAALNEMADSDSVSTIKRFISLTYLNKDLLDMVDKGDLFKMSQGVLISRLNKDEQSILLELLKEKPVAISLKQAEGLKKLHDNRKINKASISSLLYAGVKPRDTRPKAKFDEKALEKFIPETFRKMDVEKKMKYHENALKIYADYLKENPEEIDQYL